MRATAIIQAAVAAAAGGDVPPDNTIENGYTETFVDEARADSLATGEAAGRAIASTFGTLIGTIANSSSALGVVTREQGQYACDVTGSVPTNPETDSWVTLEAQLADGRSIQSEFLGFLNLNSVPTGDVMPYIGWCTGDDLATADTACLFAIDNSSGDARVSIRSKKNGTWDAWNHSPNDTPGGIGVRGTIGFSPHLSGDPSTTPTARVLAPSGAADSANSTARTLSQSLFPLSDLTGGTTLHLVIGFTVLNTVGAAVPTTATPLVTLVGAPALEGVSGSLAVMLALSGQSNANGLATGVPVNPLVGTYNQNGTYLSDWPATDDASSAAGMLTDDADTIKRGVYEQAIGGTDILEHVSTIGPSVISNLQNLGITPPALLFWQGERDAGDAGRAAAYAGSGGLAAYLDLMHAAFPNMHILLVEVQATASTYTEVAVVNGAMQAEAAARSYVHILVTRGEVELQGDNLHATLAGQIYVGGAGTTWMVDNGHWDSVA